MRAAQEKKIYRVFLALWLAIIIGLIIVSLKVRKDLYFLGLSIWISVLVHKTRQGFPVARFEQIGVSLLYCIALAFMVLDLFYMQYDWLLRVVFLVYYPAHLALYIWSRRLARVGRQDGRSSSQ